MASHTVSIISAASECSSFVGTSSVFQRGKSLNCGGNLSLDSSKCIHASSEYQFITRAELPTVQFSSRTCPQLRNDSFSCYSTQCSSRSSLADHSNKSIFGSSRPSSWGWFGGEKDGRSPNWRNGTSGWKGCVCQVSGGSEVGSSEWMSRATPYEVLGIAADSSEEEIKSAFRARIKEYHPDVYQGLRDADAITQRLLQAYELLTGELVGTVLKKRRSLDPFEEPECVAEDVFVNELACIGRGCPYSCVERAPDVFQFAAETGWARAYNQDSATWMAGKGGYHVQLAVGQCPRNCIHYVTPEQRFRLEEILKSVLEGTVYSGEAAIMTGLIAKANFENGRYNPSPKRKVKKSEQWVDWY
ncbi:unnamed protein product [Calypogeia fissa]